jgi:hypothetical protein
MPRYGIYDADGNGYDNDEIPGNVEKATCELALALLKDTSMLADTGLEGFEQTKVGSLSVTPRASRKAGALPQHVKRFLAEGHVWAGTAGVSGRLVRG